ncbi:MAG: hypothetical protein AB7R69_03685 [Candidatus Babeliales bacterium]
MRILYSIFITFITTSFLLHARSPFRPIDPHAPTICAQWQGEKTQYSLVHSHLQEGPYFNLFDKKHFYDHLLPYGPITYRHSRQTVNGAVLSELVQHLLKEVHEKKKEFTHFTVLKQRDFNTRDQTGLIIARFKNYPFVVKLFVETPESFVSPLSKGFETSALFILGNGITRHLSGFTRIKNLERLREKVQQNSYWKDKIAFPRKWFWLPRNPRWLTITGKNMGPEETRTTDIPAVYALICDYIDVKRMFSLKSDHDRMTAMSLSNYLQQDIDPHINNYAVEKGTQKIIPIDTEHFPTMVGYDNPPLCKSYLQWYTNLGFKLLDNALGRTKEMRRHNQRRRHWPMKEF